ncbi:MAG: hypothetical protein M3N82_05410 [Pseudomonadota bacterium]|nr:hypothetical protein [Pseudomonadota bacterium]
MSAEAAALARTWSVGRWTVTVTLPEVAPGQMRHAVLEWSPAMPTRPLSKSQMRQYRRGRDRALGELAAALVGPALLLEVV